jgi:UDP-N-acetylmuramoyl-tripeptide--D-alanyl-D-alanine ligase
MKKLLEFKLKILAKLIIWRYRPKVIGISGSVGKTSAREAISLVLATRFRVGQTLKNYNNEIGLPLTILGLESPGSSLFGWALLFLKALKMFIFKDKKYPEVLVLEMGIDRPGDMKYLTSIVRPDIGVITMISESHLEYFKTIENTIKEKGELVKQIKPGGAAVLNFDSQAALAVKEMTKVKVYTYGQQDGADLKAEDFNENEKLDLDNLALNFKINYQGAVVPIYIPQVVAISALYSSLAAAVVGSILGLNLIEIAQALKNLKMPLGRMNIIPGIKRTTIVDDTYNASPDSTKSALWSLARVNIGSGRKVAVLGDMLELGTYSVSGHNLVGAELVKAGFDLLISVGEKARDIAFGAKENGLSPDYIFSFNNSKEAALFVQERIKTGDLILIKGSQGARMEIITKEIMAEPLLAKQLLVRQEDKWIK